MADINAILAAVAADELQAEQRQASASGVILRQSSPATGGFPPEPIDSSDAPRQVAMLDEIGSGVDAVTESQVNDIADAKIAAHEAASDPHPDYTTDAEVAAIVGTRTAEVVFFQGGTLTWSAMPATATVLAGVFHPVRRRNLAGYTQARLVIIQQFAGFSGAKLSLRYSASLTSTYASTTQLGASAEVEVALSTSNVTSSASGWIDLASGAQGDVFLVPFGIDGNGSTSPSFWVVMAEFR